MSQITRSHLVEFLMEYATDEAQLQHLYTSIQAASPQIQKALLGQYGSYIDISKTHTQQSWQCFIQKISGLITEAEFICMRDELAQQGKPEPISIISLQNLVRMAGIEIIEETESV